MWKWKSLSHVRLFATPWTVHSPGQNAGVGSLSLLWGIFPTQGLNPSPPHCRRMLYQMSHQGSIRACIWQSSNSFLKTFNTWDILWITSSWMCSGDFWSALICLCLVLTVLLVSPFTVSNYSFSSQWKCLYSSFIIQLIIWMGIKFKTGNHFP